LRETRYRTFSHGCCRYPKIWLRLQRVGAVAIKNSVYVMPRSDQSLEDFQWTVREITEGGGDAWICEAGFVEGISNDQVEALFRGARDADYAGISEEAKELAKKFPVGERLNEEHAGELEPAVARMRRRLIEIVAIDFFDSLGRQSAEGLVAGLEARVNPDASADDQAARSSGEYLGRVWVTRKGIHVDRMASAWLIKRFIDPEAKFKFVPARGYQPEKREVRFDMFEADFTHEGDRCTFELLLQHLKLNHPALRAIAEIVHDIDLKDGKFGRPETPGIERLITGICTVHKEDETRLARASAIFEDLHGSFRDGLGTSRTRSQHQSRKEGQHGSRRSRGHEALSSSPPFRSERVERALRATDCIAPRKQLRRRAQQLKPRAGGNRTRNKRYATVSGGGPQRTGAHVR